MYLVLLEIIEKKILDESKIHCEACQVNSDSQFDHAQSGNCLDETTDFVTIYCADARSNVQVNEIMVVFDKVCKELGLKPIFSKQLAKGALAWIPTDEIISKIHNPAPNNSPCLDIVTCVYHDIVNQ